MKIISIEIENWRAFSSVKFDFDGKNKDKNCVLIGADNGFGKTSFFEAITLCLYGKFGLSLLARAEDQALEHKPHMSYDKFMSSVLHKGALITGQRRVLVKIEFQRSVDRSIVVERHWHFGESSTHRSRDEEFTVKVDGQYLNKDEFDTEEEWQRSVVKQYFVPHDLARFFLFDGEMVRDLARMEMENQVRAGIEGLMGIPVLTELQRDLAKYVPNRLSNVRAVGDKNNRRNLGEEIASLEEQSEKLQRSLTDDKIEQDRKTRKQDELHNELAGLGLTGRENIKLLHEEKNSADMQVNKLRDDLQEKLVGEFSMALAGRAVIRKAIDLLNSDKVLEEWSNSQGQVNRRQESFIKEVKSELQSKDYEIPTKYHSTVISLIESTWRSIWHPKPSGCPNEPYFGAIFGSTRGAVHEHLNCLESDTGVEVGAILSKIVELKKFIREKENEIGDLEEAGPRNETITRDLRVVGDRIKEISVRIGESQRELETIESELSRKNAALSQIVSMDRKSQPTVKLTETAKTVSKFIDKLIDSIAPIQSSGLESAMTRIYTKLSSKNAVHKICISPDSFQVKLIGRKNQDVRENKMSAGEEQIFSQSLISAVVEVSSFDFPMIIDTPLARLDKAHRKSILNYLASLPRQVILLSTNTEVVGDYYSVVKPSISDSYILEYNQEDDIGHTTASRGYFV